MKSQISRHSYDPSKRYSGVLQQQGRMITDADWNEMQAIAKARLDEALRDVVGGGVPGARPLTLRFNQTELEIVPGVLYANGLAASLGAPGGAAFTYATQPDFPSAPGPVALNDVLYVDAWEREVSYLEDPGLQDPGLNGADTCTRTQTMLQIKRAPADFAPESDVRNPALGNALLGVGLRRAQSSTDILDPAADEVAIDQPVGNFLFRVEVHDVEGPADNPTSITLKWSSENAAEAYATSGTIPPDYKGSDWSYEFHGPTSEKRLGVHLVPVPARRPLDDGYPPTAPDATTLPWVRRWDGFCVLTRASSTSDWTNASISAGKDRGVALSPSVTDGVHGHAVILATPATGTPTSLILRLNLELVDLQLHLKGNSFVAGDYWFAMARDQFVSGQQLLDSQPPLGAVHRYLQLGKVAAQGAALSFQPSRPLAFPTLTDLVADTSGASGGRRIGAEGVSGNPSTLARGTVGSQLSALLGLLNTSNQRNDPRYLRRAGAVTVQLDSAQPKAVFTSVNPPAAVTFTYSEYDASETPFTPRRFVQGSKTEQIQLHVDKDNQKGQPGITTDIFWHHVFVTNRTSPFVKLQVDVEVFMIAPPVAPEKGGTIEGKDTTTEKSSAESAKAAKEAKEAKEGKDTPDKTDKENKEGKENTEKTDKDNKDTKEQKDNPDKAGKEQKESKESKENKEAAEKTSKESKEIKESKENKEAKEATKESKEKEASKEHKEQKDNKEVKDSKEDEDKVSEKGNRLQAKEIDRPIQPLSLQLASLPLDPDLAAIPGDHHAFIRPDERPPVGDSLARRKRTEAPPV